MHGRNKQLHAKDESHCCTLWHVCGLGLDNTRSFYLQYCYECSIARTQQINDVLAKLYKWLFQLDPRLAGVWQMFLTICHKQGNIEASRTGRHILEWYLVLKEVKGMMLLHYECTCITQSKAV